MELPSTNSNSAAKDKRSFEHFEDYETPTGHNFKRQMLFTDHSYSNDPITDQFISSESHYNFANSPEELVDTTIIPSSPVLEWGSSQDSTTYADALRIINELFEHPSRVARLDFSDLKLTRIPTQISDIPSFSFIDDNKISHVEKIEIFCQRNLFDAFPKVLESVSSLITVLSLRENFVSTIPYQALKQLVNITELNLSKNNIKYFPSSLLNLNKINILNISFNDLLPPASDAIECKLNELPGPTCFKVSKRKASQPSLVELCLRLISQYQLGIRESQLWNKKIPYKLVQIINDSFENFEYCSECETVTVSPQAEVLEWWDLVGIKNVPIKRFFCSSTCFSNWEALYCVQELKDEI